MNKKSCTKDELFLLKLYQMTNVLGDARQEMDRYVVGRAAGYNTRSVDNIVRLLTQMNFLKKGEGDSVYITENGLRLISELLT